MGKHTHSSQCVSVCVCVCHTQSHTHAPACFPLNTHLFRQTKMFTVFTSTWCGLRMVFIFFFICLYFLNSPHWVVLITILKHPRPHLNALNSWCRLNSVKQKKKSIHYINSLPFNYSYFLSFQGPQYKHACPAVAVLLSPFLSLSLLRPLNFSTGCSVLKIRF